MIRGVVKLKKLIIGCVSMILLIVFTACGTGGNTGSPSNTNSGGQSNSQSAPSASGGIQKPVTLTWAAGGMGGGWYSMAGGIASVIKEKNTNINIKVIPGGSLQNIPFLDNGDAQIAWEQPAFVLAGKKGEDPFKKESPDLVAIGNGFGVNYFHFVVAANSNIKSVDDIFAKGKKVKIALTPVNNADEWVFRKILEYYKSSYDDIKKAGGGIFQGSYSEQAEQFKNDNVDVVFAQLAIPGSSIIDASVSRQMKILPMPDALIDYLGKYTLGKGKIPAGTYPKAVNGNEDITTATMGNILVVSKKVPDDVVYEITKIINENRDRLPFIHASLNDYKIEAAINNLGTELHPGAAKYYKEKGIIK
jgi:uncharacterized protein